MRARLLFALLLLPLAALAQTTDRTEEEWNAVLALEAGPQQTNEIQSREQARKLSLAHLEKQETALREFLHNHPKSSHAVDAQLSLARLLSTRSDLTGKPAFFDAAQRLLTEALKTAPEERRADLAFARIALGMRRIAVPTDKDREALAEQMNTFQSDYPNDRRVAPLITEVATLFDDQPHRKQTLLNQAMAAARTPELRARIEDDLQRLALLGRPIEVRGTTASGAEVDLARFRGRVVLVYFFASWSAPSLAGLEEVEYLRKTFAKEPLEVIGVSLDPTPEALDAVLKAHNISWPVIFDGKGWIVDRQGCLRTLNAKTESEKLVRELLKEKKNEISIQ